MGAIAGQELSDALPLGLWNEGEAEARALSALCAALALGALGVLGFELATRRRVRGSGVLLGLVAAGLLLEALLGVLDVTLVSRGAAVLGGPYREVPGPAGPVTLKKPHAGSPHGFRTTNPYPKQGPNPRLLFLGDSYTEGSGRAAACNYPEVAGAVLAETLGRPVDVLNAGVAGYGPRDALRLLELLTAEGYAYDAIVYGLFLENDFTDNLPGTERRVVAGINFRFPESGFLRAFHPLNTRTFRYALFFERTSGFLRGNGQEVRRDEGACDLAPTPLERIPDALRELVLRRLEANYAPGAVTADAEVAEAVDGMRRIAGGRGVPFVLVVFPDRVLVDPDLRAALGLESGLRGYEANRLRDLARERFGQTLVVDTMLALRAGSENFRPDDTHLSDLGNLRVGRRVGRLLAQALPRVGFDL